MSPLLAISAVSVRPSPLTEVVKVLVVSAWTKLSNPLAAVGAQDPVKVLTTTACAGAAATNIDKEAAPRALCTKFNM